MIHTCKDGTKYDVRPNGWIRVFEGTAQEVNDGKANFVRPTVVAAQEDVNPSLSYGLEEVNQGQPSEAAASRQAGS